MLTHIDYKLLKNRIMKTLEIISILFVALFVVSMVASVLLYSIPLVMCSFGCMFLSIVFLEAAYK